MRKCPNCGKTLVPFRFAGLQIEACPACAGIWFDADELKQAKAGSPTAWTTLDKIVVPRAPAAAAEAQEKQAKKCPVCHAPMRPYRFLAKSDIWLDECDGCHGRWVDDGELAKMQAYLAEVQEAEDQIPAESLAAMAQLAAESRMSRGRANAVVTVCRGLMTSVRGPVT